MKPFRKIAIAALAATVAGTALTAGLSASAQNAAASGDGGQQTLAADGQRLAQMDERGGPGYGFGHGFGHGFGPRGGGKGAERLFERFDVNEDGVITTVEIEEVRTKDFTGADTDGNGEISLEEFKAAFLDRSNDRMVRAFQFLDRDGDGTVSQAEMDFAANSLFNMLDRDGNGTVERVRGPEAGKDGKRGERGGPRGHGRMFLGLFDADGDGKVSREDFDAKRAELFALADTSGSGSFTLEDFGPLWLAVNEGRIVNMFQRADADGSLGISAEEQATHQERMLKRADRNKDGVITKADFKSGHRGDHGKGKGKGKHQHEHQRG
ncbi:EF-hand domain-containing protein [Roseibium sp. M-1]